jgi:hypothetical protein
MRGAVVAALGLTLACGTMRDNIIAVPASSERDSSGIRIVESTAPAWTAATAWRVADEPDFDIGGSERDTTTQFASIRGAHYLPNGTIAVLDARSHSLRFFDRSGRMLGQVGRAGSGPGEFQRTQVPRSRVCGTDTVYVPILGVIAVFAAPGRYVREFRLKPAVGRFANIMGCHGNRFFAWSEVPPPVRLEGLHRENGAIATYDLDGNVTASLGTFPVEDLHWRRVPGEGMGYALPPYGRRLASAFGNGTIAMGIGDSFEIELRDGSGTLREILRAPHLDRPLTDSEVRRLREFLLSRNYTEGSLDILLAEEKLPGTLPAFAQFLFDADQNLWVRSYDFADATVQYDRVTRTSDRAVHESTRRWHVFAATGALLGNIELPPRFEVHQIGADWILGVWRSEMDVEHVRLYTLRKPVG